MTSITGDQKKEFAKAKHDLEDWREVILLANSVLKWDQMYFAGIIAGAVTFLYIFLWYLDLSLLTLFSLTMLTITLIDFGYPFVAKVVFKPESWTGTQEKSFEEVVHELLSIKNELCSNIKGFYVPKEDRSTVYVIKTSVLLILLAWIGSSFDNLFLCYILTLAISLYPGLSKHGFVKQFVSILDTHVLAHVRKITGHAKAE